ncbi:MAG TPA: ATP-binding protein, partial [Candidatus Angelobacter sp.]|nr:ATP-binding protein [Candidatus Angelobacter sp.]
MKKGANWQEGNTLYLATALAWLRLLLERLAARQHDKPAPPALPDSQQKQPKASRRQSVGRKPELSAKTRRLLLAGHSATPDRDIAQAAAAMQEAAKIDPPPALLILAQRLGLSQFEQQVLILCLGMELDPSVAGLCARCQKDPARTYPTFALAFMLFENASWDAISPERPLRFWRLIEIIQPGGQPFTTSALRADERILNYCKGLNYLDDRLLPMVNPIDLAARMTSLPASHRENVDTIVNRLRLVEENRSLPIIQ